MDTAFDLAVIGGGVNGAGVARDAAGRGARVLLLEKDDLASGTSSASTKLVHGGLRYLEYREFRLVREALGEREKLWGIAPHIIRPMRFVLPHTPGLRPAWMLRAGLFLYDHIGGRKRLPAADTVNLAHHPAGAPLAPGFSTAFEYSDAWVDDARLVVLNAMDAAAHGATIRTRTQVTGARREGGLWRIGTSGGSFTARALVNAAGPGVAAVLEMLGETPACGIRPVRGSHIVVPRLFDHDYAYIFQLPDTRIVFAIPYEGAFILIGTTDAEHEGSLDDVRASAAEIAYLCEAAGRYFARPVSPDDVVWSYSGVRPLIDDGSGRPEAATRGYRMVASPEEDGAPLLTIYGGKITSYRHVAQEAVDRVAARLPTLSGPRWTASAPLPGGDFATGEIDVLVADLARRFPFLGPDQALRIGRAYGTFALRWLGTAARAADLGRDFGGGLTEAEVAYLRDAEWAVTAEDILWRRTKTGLHMSADQRAAFAAFLGEG